MGGRGGVVCDEVKEWEEEEPERERRIGLDGVDWKEVESVLWRVGVSVSVGGMKPVMERLLRRRRC